MKKSFINRVVNEGNVWTKKYHYFVKVLPAYLLAIYRNNLDAYGHDVLGSTERIMVVEAE